MAVRRQADQMRAALMAGRSQMAVAVGRMQELAAGEKVDQRLEPEGPQKVVQMRADRVFRAELVYQMLAYCQPH